MKKTLLVFLLLLTSSAMVFAQRQISGKVSADDGSELPGVSVLVVGTTAGAYTDASGKFTLNLPANAKTLEFRAIGFVSQVVNLSNSNFYNITMVTDENLLEELVVTAGGILVKKRELGAASTTINPTMITQGKASNFAASLSGKVPGLQVNAVSGGLNPNYRLVLRGTRSITGNNQALLVLDNLIVPNDLLGNLNPEDIEDIQVLNGASAAAAYGSDASNGAIVITTKKGKKGVNEIQFSNTTTFEKTSYFPQLQRKFGSGTTPDNVKEYTPYENQQYGPKFDGTLREVGHPLQDGSVQSVIYSPTNDKYDFWETGLANQTDLSMQSGDDKGSYYLAAQNFYQKSTMPGDKYNRITVRANGVRNLYRNFKATFGASFITNKYDQTSIPGSIYGDLLQTPSQIPVTKYKDWRNDPFANPNGYYNDYYDNPYWLIDQNRRITNNNYFQGNLEFAYNPIKDITLTYRAGINTRNVDYTTTGAKFTFSDYTRSISTSKTNVTGSVTDYFFKSVQVVTELIAEYRKKLSPSFDLHVLGAGYLRDNQEKTQSSNTNGGLVIDGLYNLSNSVNPVSSSESNEVKRQLSLRGEARLGFKDYLFLHVTGRNDWNSVLAAANRSFFYPGVDVSFVASEAIPAIKSSTWLNTLKLRAAYSYVGNVNLDPYRLNPTFSVAGGYPYSSGNAFTADGGIVADNLKPEISKGPEAGLDFELLQGRITGGGTVYKTNTYNQTLSSEISRATGFSTYLVNIGEVENKGIETYLTYSPWKNYNGLTVTIGGNYSLNRNKVLSLTDDSDELTLPNGSFTGGLIVAKVGHPFPLLKNTTYDRDPQGRVIVDRNTGFPSSGGTQSIVGVTNPPHILGGNLEINYKRLRFYTLFEYRNGHYIFNSVSTGYDFSGSGIRTAWYNRERFVFPNSSYLDPETGQYVENTNIQTRSGGADFWTSGTRNTGIGENYVHSAGFWKWREASISYNIPVNTFLKGAVKRASISVQGRNLFIWTPKTNLYTDPEYSDRGSTSNTIGITTLSQIPPARYFGGTLSLTF